MPDFNDIRRQFNQSQTQVEKARLGLFHAGERLRQIQLDIDKFNRYFDPKNENHIAQLRKMESERARTEGVVAGLNKRHESIQADLSGVWKEFENFTDPRTRIQEFDSGYPVLLFPVRLETRFKTVQTPRGAIQNQLWVRIYPDDCLIDSFEETLSHSEIDNAKRYWTGILLAAGDENKERAYWRNLVASHGTGRASYIIETYLPDKVLSDTKPMTPNDSTIYLVVSADTLLINPVEKTAIKDYWIAFWRADGDETKQQLALDKLKIAVGSDRAEVLTKKYGLSNIKEKISPEINRQTASVKILFIFFPVMDETKSYSWSHAPKVKILPERFVFIGESSAGNIEQLGNPILSPLVVGPNPTAQQDKQFKLIDGDLNVPEDMKWMVDFDEAIRVGMGFKINLSPEQVEAGFDRLLVLGVRLSNDVDEGKELLEKHFTHHLKGPSGFSILPQGTPTNNTETGGSGFTRSDDADFMFDFLKKIKKDGHQFDPNDNDFFSKKDGSWLAEMLGIDNEIMQNVPFANETGLCEARAMNTALWSATLGYWMDTQMNTVFDDDTIHRTRDFFRTYITGRGILPAIRIGKQPYGILPTTNFSDMEWLTNDFVIGTVNKDIKFIRDLYSKIKAIELEYWKDFTKNTSHVGQNEENPQQLLLNIIGLNASSVEFHQQWAESNEHLWNYFRWQNLINPILFFGKSEEWLSGAHQLLQDMGFNGEKDPDILNKIFLEMPPPLEGPIIDDRPLSEKDPIRKYTLPPSEKNYIEWLHDTAKNSFENLRTELGLNPTDKPIALLYIMLRHALELGYYDVSLQLHRQAELMSAETYRQAKIESPFIHVTDKAESSESRYKFLYKTEPKITNSDTLSIYDYIPQILNEAFVTRYLSEQIKALEHLKDTPTARLERAFAEHIDLCSYRLDAWWQGLVNYQLTKMRSIPTEDGVTNSKKGIYIGAFGWIEDLRSEKKVLTPVQLTEELDVVFNKNDKSTIVSDNTNGGYVFAPSLNHAVTAAILRNGYISNATPEHPELMNVNLSSERVRKAMQFLEGIRNGQSLGALLGYQFERGLHDKHVIAEVDSFIYIIRRAFPLQSEHLKETQTKAEDNATIDKIEARNVVDGLQLVEQINRSGIKKYPWGLGIDKLPVRTNAAQYNIIDIEADKLLDIHDAIADLAIAEGVHQIVQGNYDRAAAALDTYGKATFPSIPDVATTPRTGLTLTHRVGLHLPIIDELAMPPSAPRKTAEPAIEKWLTNILPDPLNIIVDVEYDNPVTEVVEKTTAQITWANLALDYSDMLYMLNPQSEQAMTDIDDRILHYMFSNPINGQMLRPDTDIKILYTKPNTDLSKVSFFQITPLIKSLRSLLLESRPLKAGDVMLQNEATQSSNDSGFIPEKRIDDVKLAMENLLINRVKVFENAAQGDVLLLQQNFKLNIDTIISRIDTYYDAFINIQMEASRFGVQFSSCGLAMDWKKRIFKAVFKKASDLLTSWKEKSAEFDIVMNPYVAASDTEKIEILRKAERLISNQYTVSITKVDVDNKKTAFDSALLGLNTFIESNPTKIQDIATSTGLFDTFKNQIIVINSINLGSISLEDEEKQILPFLEDLYNQTKGLETTLNQRLKSAQILINTASINVGEKKVTAQTDAIKSLLGDDFKIVPQFVLNTTQGLEWEKAFNNETQLLNNTNPSGLDYPVDEWMYGIARVRAKLHDWENIVQLLEAFDSSKPAPELHPIQLPFKADEFWFALELPENFDWQKAGERLLYTAHYTEGYSKEKPQCGLLLDEWTEVIPNKEETAGLTFHYDRPNNEPPQTLLLATPSTLGENWKWKDLVSAVKETFIMAKRRAVEPKHIEPTALARFIPATLASVTTGGISISANYAINNEIMKFVNKTPDI
jgi:hypothetical protein